jgi:uncharacterized protein (DUF58 family)
MSLRPLPSPWLLAAIGAGAVCALLALIAGVSVTIASIGALLWMAMLSVWTIGDYLHTRRSWYAAEPQLLRQLPAALAIGVKRSVQLSLQLQGEHRWQIKLHDHADAHLITEGMPVAFTAYGGQATVIEYGVTPARRGEVSFDPADLSLRSRWQACDLRTRIGSQQSRRVYPDFAQVARYAWLAGDRRLAEIGIKTYQQRGEGTDFKQLAEYRIGDAIRHIDWKATSRFGKPIVRQYQNERDQCVMLLVDCGRRMRADDRQRNIGTAHFDQVLNAIMLLTYVALKEGDAVGAITFGTAVGEERWFAPRKGISALNSLMGELYAIQPTLTHSDYLTAAKEFLRRQRKRALVIVITNFRDEDAGELGQALTLLRSRHRVLTASLRERVVGELQSQPLANREAALEIASAHLYEQSRRDAFSKIAARDALLVDAEPERLGIELVNRYQAAKRAGMV